MSTRRILASVAAIRGLGRSMLLRRPHPPTDGSRFHPLPVPRYSDVLCQPCQQNIIATGWTTHLRAVYGSQLEGSAVLQCQACVRNLARHPRGKLPTLTDLTPVELDQVSARHEAAHTITAMALGQPVERVWIQSHAATHPRRTCGSRARLRRPIRVSLLDYATICCAGPLGSFASLAAQGHDTPTNRLDVWFRACGDTRSALRAIRQHDASADLVGALQRCRDRAADLIQEYWYDIDLLQAGLLQHQELYYDEDTPLMIDASAAV